MTLKRCPCGKIPNSLLITEGYNVKWAWVSGDCCNEWNIEFRTNYFRIDTPQCMALAENEYRYYASVIGTDSSNEYTDKQYLRYAKLMDKFYRRILERLEAHND